MRRGSRLHRIVFASAIGVALLARAPRASADEKAVCLAASEKGQQLRNRGKLEDARAQFAICARVECPALVRSDCNQWMGETLQAAPSIVVGAKDRGGNDLVDVHVLLDGKVVTTTLDGKPILVDPGVHTIRYEHVGAPAVEERIVVNQGEKNRVLQVTFQSGTPKEDPVRVEPEGRKLTPVIVGLGVLGLLGGAGTVFFLFSANGAVDDARNECAPNCSQERVDEVSSTVNTNYVLAGVSGGVGALALGGAALLYFTQPTGDSKAAARFDLRVRPLQGGSVTEVRWTF